MLERLHVFVTQILLYTFELARQWAKENSNIKFFRLYTSERDNTVAQILYKKYMDIVEKYDNVNDIDFDNTYLIYSKLIVKDNEIELWNNKFLNLKNGEEMIVQGYKYFIKLTNGDIHIQIAPSGEVF